MKNIQMMLQKIRSQRPSTPESQAEEEMTGLETDNIMSEHLDWVFAELKAERNQKKG